MKYNADSDTYNRSTALESLMLKISTIALKRRRLISFVLFSKMAMEDFKFEFDLL